MAVSFTNPVSPLDADFNPAHGWLNQYEFPRQIIDVNGDGYADIAGFGDAGVLVSYGSAQGTFSGASLLPDTDLYAHILPWEGDEFPRELTEFNRDGRADIVAYEHSGVVVSIAQGGNFTDQHRLDDFGIEQGWTSQDSFPRRVADVNGDGTPDIVGFGIAGTWVALGNGDGTLRPVQMALADFGTNQGWTSDDKFHRVLADVNGDGKADIVGFGYAGTYVALAKGDGTFFDAQLASKAYGVNSEWDSNNEFPRLVGDVNHDGRADIVSFAYDGTYVALAQPDGTFADAAKVLANFSPAQGWVNNNTYPRELADVNNDGRLDIVGFGAPGVLVGFNQGDLVL